jgi:DNA helicase-2/ATP-dependent DNA helicase PcrA
MLIEHGALYDRDSIFLRVGAPRIKSVASIILPNLRERFPEIQTDEIDHAIVQLAEAEMTTGMISLNAFDTLSRFDEIVHRFDSLLLDESICAFLDFASLYQTQDGIEHRDAVSLITIYAAKGLEFPRVFVVGLEQGQIPSFYAVKSGIPSEIEEQRRLLYVAITRAKERLILTGVASRDGYPQEHSQFLRELQLDYDFDTPPKSASTSSEVS